MPVNHMYRKIIKPTPFGSVAIIWTPVFRKPKILRVLLSTPELSAEHQVLDIYPDSRESSCAGIEDIAKGIKRLLEGEAITLSLDFVDLGSCGGVQKQVLRADHQIPRGNVSTYRLIGAYLDKPNGARAVGNALATNPFPLIVPCHRTVRSDCQLGGYQGGPEMKRALLEREGITFDNAGRVVCPHFFLYNDRWQ